MSESMYGGWSIGQINIKYKRGTKVLAQGQCIAIDGGGGLPPATNCSGQPANV